MSPELHVGMHAWSLPVSVTLALTAVTLSYVRGWYRLRKALPNVLSIWRLAAFVGGMSVVWAAVASPLSTLDHQLLTAHMAQHLLLMTVAAPLLLLSAPAIVLLQGLPPRLVRDVLGPVLRRRVVRDLGDMVAHPAFCWLASTFTVIGWHVPAVFELGMRSPAWHMLQHASFLAAGLLFWWPVIQPWPSLAEWQGWRIPMYLFLATLPCDALSAFLTFCDRVVYPQYLSAHKTFFMSALADQECAGALMWVWVTLVYLVPAATVTLQMLSPQRRTSKVEAI